MKKKKVICGVLAVSMLVGSAFSGCSLISTDSEADMNQIIARVDIRKNDLGELEDYTSAISETKITKRQLVASFVNYGSSYVSAGLSYSVAFDSLVTMLTGDAVVTQYATLYTLKKKVEDEGQAVLTDFGALKTEKEKYEFLLDEEDKNLAAYNLYYTFNTMLDSIEEGVINGEDEERGDETRTTPTGVDTVQENYYPKGADGISLDYYIYTGYGDYGLNASGAYKEDALDNTTNRTRIQAYNSFINTLRSNYLISSSEIVSDTINLKYIQDQYVEQLKYVLVDKYYDLYEEDREELIKANDFEVLKESYEKLLNDQKFSYSEVKVTAFETALSSLTDENFILYSPSTDGFTDNGGMYGYVYNILLPFNKIQSDKLGDLSTRLSAETISEEEYYRERAALLSNITTYDQRAAWLNGSEDYSFNAPEEGWEAADFDGDGYFFNGGDALRNYLFFGNNLLKTEKYETLEKYIGKLTYNGSVEKREDGTYRLIPNKLDIDQMLDEFIGYVNFVLGDNTAEWNKYSGYEDNTTDGSYYTDATEENIDYSKFLYATGSVNLTFGSKNDMLYPDSPQYRAMAAVNELQYAYTTDTAVLSQYLGYSVNAATTSYIKEFEYAAQTAIKQGAGTFYVCAGDYGWHIIYVVDTFEAVGGEVYTPVWTEENILEREGSFENKFYEWLKGKTLSDVSTTRRTEIIQYFGGGNAVKLYEDTYKDLKETNS